MTEENEEKQRVVLTCFDPNNEINYLKQHLLNIHDSITYIRQFNQLCQQEKFF